MKVTYFAATASDTQSLPIFAIAISVRKNKARASSDKNGGREGRNQEFLHANHCQVNAELFYGTLESRVSYLPPGNPKQNEDAVTIVLKRHEDYLKTLTGGKAEK